VTAIIDGSAIIALNKADFFIKLCTTTCDDVPVAIVLYDVIVIILSTCSKQLVVHAMFYKGLCTV